MIWTMFRATNLLLLLLLFWLPLFAEQESYEITPELSRLTFDMSAKIHQVRGTSNAFTGKITGDPDDISSAKVAIKLDPKTFDTGNESRDKVMRDKSMEIEKYPRIEFVSTAIEASDRKLPKGKPVNAAIRGTLRLHGTEKELAIPVKIQWDSKQIVAEGDVTIFLDEWDIYRPKVLFFRLENDVKAHFRIVAKRAQ